MYVCVLRLRNGGSKRFATLAADCTSPLSHERLCELNCISQASATTPRQGIGLGARRGFGTR